MAYKEGDKGTFGFARQLEADGEMYHAIQNLYGKGAMGVHQDRPGLDDLEHPGRPESALGPWSPCGS